MGNFFISACLIELLFILPTVIKSNDFVLPCRFSGASSSDSQQCAQLKKQNAKLKKVLRELTEIDSEVLVAGESVRSQRELMYSLGLQNQESDDAKDSAVKNDNNHTGGQVYFWTAFFDSSEWWVSIIQFGLQFQNMFQSAHKLADPYS